MYLGREEELPHFTAQGPTKQAAKEASARLMALSGHCVSPVAHAYYHIRAHTHCHVVTDQGIREAQRRGAATFPGW